jgi:hypothetical protein
MSFWANLFGKKVYCHGCGAVIPGELKTEGDEVYCGDTCRENYRRLSTMPPPAQDVSQQQVNTPGSDGVVH